MCIPCSSAYLKAKCRSPGLQTWIHDHRCSSQWWCHGSDQWWGNNWGLFQNNWSWDDWLHINNSGGLDWNFSIIGGKCWWWGWWSHDWWNGGSQEDQSKDERSNDNTNVVTSEELFSVPLIHVSDGQEVSGVPILSINSGTNSPLGSLQPSGDIQTTLGRFFKLDQQITFWEVLRVNVGASGVIIICIIINWTTDGEERH
mmetsp:Transcript_137466/g.194521  ORF Transcript_137466/g.194521 Transcript_137466/m.194521 type:complete len:200 (+) Transcript_137466:215-814(+)